MNVEIKLTREELEEIANGRMVAKSYYGVFVKIMADKEYVEEQPEQVRKGRRYR